MRRFEVVGKVRVESGNSLETFALAKVSRSLPIINRQFPFQNGRGYLDRAGAEPCHRGGVWGPPWGQSSAQ